MITTPTFDALKNEFSALQTALEADDDMIVSQASSIINLTSQTTDLTAQVATLQAQLAGEISQETADQQQIVAMQGQLAAVQAQLATCQVALAADEAILHPPPPPPPPLPTLTGPMMGMVPGGWWWHPDNTPDDGSYAVKRVADFERAMGRGVQLMNQSLQNQSSDWAIYESVAINTVINHPAAVIGLSPRRSALRLQLGITNQTAAANFAEISSGAQDARFNRIFQAIKARGFDRPFLGLGQESNGDWWPNTCSAGNEAAFKAAFAHVAALAKAIMPDCVVCYDVANTRAMGPAYPGAAVDAIILDYYDQGASVGDAHGLAEMLAFNKPFLVCEWATRDVQRGASFIDFFWKTCTGSPLFIGQCYWNRDEAYLGAFATNPLSAAQYLVKFGGQNPPIYVPPPPLPGTVTIVVKGWKSGSNPESTLDLLIGGVVQAPANQTTVVTGSKGGTWVVPKMRSGDQFAVRVNFPAGKWWTVTSIVGTNDDGAGNWTFTPAGGTMVINTGSTATVAVP